MFTSCYTHTSGADLFPKLQITNDLSVAASKKLQQQRQLLGQERQEQNNRRAATSSLTVREAFTAIASTAATAATAATATAPTAIASTAPTAPKYIRINGRELIGLMRSLRMWSGVLRRRLEREFIFQTTDDALCFVNYVQGIALRLNHYPKITLLKMRVMIQLRTTEVDGISNKDVELAQLIDELSV